MDRMRSLSTRTRLVGALLAAAVAGGGLVAFAVHDDRGMCSHIQRRVAGWDSGETATQSWDDIYTLQVDVSQGLWLRHYATEVCGS